MEVIIGHARMNGTRKLVELKGRINQCSYSEKELVVKRIEAKDDIDYETLIKFGLDKQTFAELHDTLKKKTMGTRIIETGVRLKYMMVTQTRMVITVLFSLTPATSLSKNVFFLNILSLIGMAGQGGL